MVFCFLPVNLLKQIKIKMKKLHIPYYFIAFRFLLIPVIGILGYFYGDSLRYLVLALMYLGLLSDIFDGIIARNLGVQTATMRRLDSQVDMLFWLTIGFYSYWIHPEIINEHINLVRGVLAMEVICYVMSFVKFGKESAFHPLLSKTWGLSLLAAFTGILGFAYGGFTFKLAVFLGVISHVDRLLITWILPKWTHDVPSSYHAWKIRQGKKIRRHKLFN